MNNYSKQYQRAINNGSLVLSLELGNQLFFDLRLWLKIGQRVILPGRGDAPLILRHDATNNYLTFLSAFPGSRAQTLEQRIVERIQSPQVLAGRSSNSNSISVEPTTFSRAL